MDLTGWVIAWKWEEFIMCQQGTEWCPEGYLDDTLLASNVLIYFIRVCLDLVVVQLLSRV